MLDWSMLDLANAAGVSVSSVKRIEMATQPVSADVYAAVQGALEHAGMCFLADDGSGMGLRLRPQ